MNIHNIVGLLLIAITLSGCRVESDHQFKRIDDPENTLSSWSGIWTTNISDKEKGIIYRYHLGNTNEFCLILSDGDTALLRVLTIQGRHFATIAKGSFKELFSKVETTKIKEVYVVIMNLKDNRLLLYDLNPKLFVGMDGFHENLKAGEDLLGGIKCVGSAADLIKGLQNVAHKHKNKIQGQLLLVFTRSVTGARNPQTPSNQIPSNLNKKETPP